VSESGSVDRRGALEAVERILNRGGDADEVLRAVLEALHARGVQSARVRFFDDRRLVDGPAVGAEAKRVVAPVVYEGAEIGSLELAADDHAFVARVATLISPYVVRLETSGGQR
jgi:hypothetical protein